MKKKIVLLTAFALVALLVGGGTMAWFTANAEVENKFEAGTVKIRIHEDKFEDAENVNPGDCYEKKVKIENEGSKTAYVRVKLIPTWVDENGKKMFPKHGQDPAKYNAPSKWHKDFKGDWFEYNGWYYYRYKLSSRSKTSPVITKVWFDGWKMGNEYQGAKFTLMVKAEAIQASNNAILYKWGQIPGIKLNADLDLDQDSDQSLTYEVLKSIEGFEDLTEEEFNNILNEAF